MAESESIAKAMGDALSEQEGSFERLGGLPEGEFNDAVAEEITQRFKDAQSNVKSLPNDYPPNFEIYNRMELRQTTVSVEFPNGVKWEFTEQSVETFRSTEWVSTNAEGKEEIPSDKPGEVSQEGEPPEPSRNLDLLLSDEETSPGTKSGNRAMDEPAKIAWQERMKWTQNYVEVSGKAADIKNQASPEDIARNDHVRDRNDMLEAKAKESPNDPASAAKYSTKQGVMEAKYGRYKSASKELGIRQRAYQDAKGMNDRVEAKRHLKDAQTEYDAAAKDLKSSIDEEFPKDKNPVKDALLNNWRTIALALGSLGTGAWWLIDGQITANIYSGCWLNYTGPAYPKPIKWKIKSLSCKPEYIDDYVAALNSSDNMQDDAFYAGIIDGSAENMDMESCYNVGGACINGIWCGANITNDNISNVLNSATNGQQCWMSPSCLKFFKERYL